MTVQSFLTKKITVIPLTIVISILWGSAFPVIKLIYSELGVESVSVPARIFLASLRFLIASAILLCISLLAFRNQLLVKKELVPRIIVLGFFQTILQYIFLYVGMANTTGSKGSILTSTLNFFLIIICHFYYKDDKINLTKFIGLIIGFSGIALANWDEGMSWTFKMNGEFLLILVGLVSAIGYFMAKEISREANPIIVTTWQMIVGSLILLLIGLVFMKPGDILHISEKGWLLILYSGAISSIIFPLWYSVLKYNKAGEITVYKFIVPLAGTLISSLIVPGEVIPPALPAALFLVAIGIMIVNYHRKASKDKEAVT
ncbi:DMT(Drug/metabolite transporter) superfamily permease [Mesotoga infera]|uniref:DMT(Drug/metabolite transporter) superfamily permease n=1 Tax=Mesotoga infera TaxID=1236046 RepID=A0A7Z7LEE0_9BACT|nr:DMT family transporter [Mesotoga infera]SSC12546.1 DMT(Drug/metabolite transporter) superfamily permease [Mesotoga infera]